MSTPQDSISARMRLANALIPQVPNFTLAGLYIFLNVFQFFILPLFLLPRSMRWALLLVPLALTNNPFFALIHEAVHGQFSASRAVNSAFGRILSVFFGSSFACSVGVIFRTINSTAPRRNKEPKSTIRKRVRDFQPRSNTTFRSSPVYICSRSLPHWHFCCRARCCSISSPRSTLRADNGNG